MRARSAVERARGMVAGIAIDDKGRYMGRSAPPGGRIESKLVMRRYFISERVIRRVVVGKRLGDRMSLEAAAFRLTWFHPKEQSACTNDR